jgi:DNA-binding IclR family transcriptional regulator
MSVRASPRPTPDPAAALLELLATQDGMSVARACKRLALSRSELQRLLAKLGDSETLGGLGLVRIESGDGRETLWLTDCARSLSTSPQRDDR